MDWIQSVQCVLNYIEANILDEKLDNDTVAKQAYSSSANFQRIFSIVTGVTIADYIRCRKLTLAGIELAESNVKVIDTALKYGYYTPDSFAKAFMRFHGITPSEARKNPNSLKCFSPISIRIEVRGGFSMSRIITFPTGDNPWVGGSDFLRCFASLHMHLEDIELSQDMRFWLYRKFLAVTGMGMVTTFTDNPDENNYSFEAAHDFVGRAYRFAGYGYAVLQTIGQTKEEVFKTIATSIDNSRPVLAVFKGAKFNRKWRLFVEYVSENMTLFINTENEISIMPDWFDNLDSFVIVTQTGLPKPDMKDVLLEIIHDAERLESQGEKYGYASYEKLIAHLNDDMFFQNADNTVLEQLNKALGSFFWYHAEARGATGEGYDQLCGQELSETKYDISANGFWGYNGHQISYIGCNALQKGYTALRKKSHRDILIYALQMLMSNDSKIINTIKRAINIDTPDMLIPKDINGLPVDYSFRSKAQLGWDLIKAYDIALYGEMSSYTVETILAQCKKTKTTIIDFTDEKAFTNNRTTQTFNAPLKIEVVIESKEDVELELVFGDGFVKSDNWKNQSGAILVRDMVSTYTIDYWSGLELPQIEDDIINIALIIQRSYIAVVVNGQLIHYIENLPYTHFDMLSSVVGFGEFDNNTMIIKSLTISELE